MSERKNVKIRNIRSGPIRHRELPADMLAHIKSVHEVFGKYLGSTLEQFEITFMRDKHPDDEVTIWLSIATAWEAYHDKYLGGRVQEDAEEKKLLAALISISAGQENVKKLGVDEEVGRRLMECYDALGKN